MAKPFGIRVGGKANLPLHEAISEQRERARCTRRMLDEDGRRAGEPEKSKSLAADRCQGAYEPFPVFAASERGIGEVHEHALLHSELRRS